MDYILGHKEITMTTKTQIIKAVFTPTLLYQRENWTLTGKEKTDVNNWVKERRPIEYPLDADGRRVRLK